MSIAVQNLSKFFNTQKAVDAISFVVNKGEIVGFLGPNGAGKSTVMKVLTNFIKDFEGNVLINNLSVRENPIETQKLIGYLPEHNPSLYRNVCKRISFFSCRDLPSFPNQKLLNYRRSGAYKSCT